MWGDICMKIGIIGNCSFEKNSENFKNKTKFFCYKPVRSKYFKKEDYIQLLKCNVIFILTPNNSHLKYIKELYKNRHFCEKPPVNNKKDLLNYKESQEKIYFNYNFNSLN